MKNIIETICTAKGWVFRYGRKDFLNLFDEIEKTDVSHLFVEPSEIEFIHNDSGIVEAKTYSGFISILFSSSIDETDYESRYEKYIKPIVEGDLQTLKDEIRCGQNVLFNQWKTTEIVNVFDYNLDGIILTYNLTIDE